MDKNQITTKKYNFADDADLPSNCKNLGLTQIKLDLESKRESFWKWLMISPLFGFALAEYNIIYFLISIVIAICSFVYLKLRKIDDFLILDKTKGLIFTHTTTTYSSKQHIYLHFEEIRYIGVNLWSRVDYDEVEYYYVVAVNKQNKILPISPRDCNFDKISHFARFLAQTIKTNFIENPQPGKVLFISNSSPVYINR